VPILSVCLLVPKWTARGWLSCANSDPQSHVRNRFPVALSKRGLFRQKAAIPGVWPSEGHFDLGQRLLSQINDYPRVKKISFLKTWEARMIRLIAVAALAFGVRRRMRSGHDTN